jgi:hypothetical protein
MGYSQMTVECKAGVVTATLVEKEPRGEPTTTSLQLSDDTWATLWQQLDAAGWRKLVTPCPETPTDLENEITELDIAISDGKTTKDLKCDMQFVTAQHQAIRQAFEAAAALADG